MDGGNFERMKSHRPRGEHDYGKERKRRQGKWRRFRQQKRDSKDGFSRH